MFVTMVDEIHTPTHCLLERLDIKYGTHDQESDTLVFYAEYGCVKDTTSLCIVRLLTKIQQYGLSICKTPFPWLSPTSC